ncbi:MAG: hypothetical protein RQ728_07475 [Brevefilum sp.]|nr:hypothetical protein [Brevefilum sp.]MDT8382080.1 hypothetical protein [Brevefilum sp.]
MTDEKNSFEEPKCPYIGLVNDAKTSVGYPSPANVCYRVRKKKTPKLDFQRNACLTSDFVNCPIYKDPEMKKMPQSLQHRPGGPLANSKRPAKIVLTVLLLSVIVLAVFNFNNWFSSFPNWLLPAWQRTSAPPPGIITSTLYVNPTLVYRTPTWTPSTTSTPEPSATPTLEPSATPEPIVLALDVPIGKDVKFVIRQAAQGESPGQYATQYNTTIDAFFAVNYNMPSVLYVDRVVVIPVDIKDVSGLPAFETYQVRFRGQTVKDLAEDLSVDIEAFRLYNNLPEDYVFNQGDWVLVPRE